MSYHVAGVGASSVFKPAADACFCPGTGCGNALQLARSAALDRLGFVTAAEMAAFRAAVPNAVARDRAAMTLESGALEAEQIIGRIDMEALPDGLVRFADCDRVDLAEGWVRGSAWGRCQGLHPCGLRG